MVTILDDSPECRILSTIPTARAVSSALCLIENSCRTYSSCEKPKKESEGICHCAASLWHWSPPTHRQQLEVANTSLCHRTYTEVSCRFSSALLQSGEVYKGIQPSWNSTKISQWKKPKSECQQREGSNVGHESMTLFVLITVLWDAGFNHE